MTRIAFPGESAEYRAARDRLLEQEIALRRATEAVATARRALPPGGLIPEDYVPDPYIQRDYEYSRNHTWYMSARQICVNDLYAFDPNVKLDLDEFTDVIGRHFKQPKEGLGFDASPSSHMWRTIMWPTKYL